MVAGRNSKIKYKISTEIRKQRAERASEGSGGGGGVNDDNNNNPENEKTKRMNTHREGAAASQKI